MNMRGLYLIMVSAVCIAMEALKEDNNWPWWKLKHSMIAFGFQIKKLEPWKAIELDKVVTSLSNVNFIKKESGCERIGNNV